MRLRAISSVGVMLCVAMTSFSIYLGVIEHVYASPRVRVAEVATIGGRTVVCLGHSTRHNTTTTHDVGRLKAVSCQSADAHR